MTSTVSEKSTPGLRSTSALSGIDARSSARTSLSDPFTARPTGVRTASTMTASGMGRNVLSAVGAPAVALHGASPPRRSHSTGGAQGYRPSHPPPPIPLVFGAPCVERGMRTRSLLLLAAASALLALGADGTALAAGLSFTAPAQLPHGDPAQKPFYGGGEPSI